jgi:Putative DNA-binding domain
VTLKDIEKLLAADESETLERKQSLDKEGVCKSIIAFANDLYGHGRGFIIVGQAPNKDLIGLPVGDDEAQRTITDFARNNCCPAIPVSVECHEKDGKRLAVVEVRASPARPHFMGRALVRMGSTTRAATDAEIILLRAVEQDRKVAILKRWLDEGNTTVVFWQMAAAGRDFAMSPRVEQARLLEVNEQWIVLVLGSTKRAFPFCEFNIGYDPQQNLPQIRYHGGHIT